MSRPLAVVFKAPSKVYPCSGCSAPLDRLPYLGMTSDCHRLYYHLTCLPHHHLLAVAPTADYPHSVHAFPFPSNPSFSEVAEALDLLLLRAYREMKTADGGLWYRQPDRYVDPAKVEEVVCPVCELVLRDPVQLPCEDLHVLCRACWMAARLESELGSASATVPCPVCRDDCPVEDVKAERAVRKAVQAGHPLHCQRRDLGCPAQPTQGKDGAGVDSHEAQCDWRPIKCKDCAQSVSHCRLAHHGLHDCTFLCTVCQQRIQRSEASEHRNRVDPALCAAVVRCPHSCPKPIVRIAALPTHLTVCSKVLVRCHEPTCTKLHPRGDLHRDISARFDSVYPAFGGAAAEGGRSEGSACASSGVECGWGGCSGDGESGVVPACVGVV